MYINNVSHEEACRLDSYTNRQRQLQNFTPETCHADQQSLMIITIMITILQMPSQIYMLFCMRLQPLDNFALQLLAVLKFLHANTHKSCWLTEELSSINMTIVVQEQ